MVNSYTSLQRVFMAAALGIFFVVGVTNFTAALLFVGGVILGMLIGIAFKLAEAEGEVKR